MTDIRAKYIKNTAILTAFSQDKTFQNSNEIDAEFTVNEIALPYE